MGAQAATCCQVSDGAARQPVKAAALPCEGVASQARLGSSRGTSSPSPRPRRSGSATPPAAPYAASPTLCTTGASQRRRQSPEPGRAAGAAPQAAPIASSETGAATPSTLPVEGIGRRAACASSMKRRSTIQGVSSRCVIRDLASQTYTEEEEADSEEDPDLTCDVWGRSRSKTGRASEEAEMSFVSHDMFWYPEQTVIIVDWDDTLFPTTWLESDMQLRIDRPIPSGRLDISLPLDRLAKRAQAFLRTASENARYVVVVTLAKAPWVDTCMRNYVPGLAKTLEVLCIPVVYARDHVGGAVGREEDYDKAEFEAQGSSYWTAVKAVAIRDQCERCYSQYPGQTWKNVLSVGDSNFEREGTQAVVRQWCAANARTAYQLPRTKTVKFLDDPTCQEVCDQLKLMIAWLPDLLRRDGSFNIDMDAAGSEDITGVDDLIGCVEEGPSAALLEGRLWKLSAGGDPLKPEDWLRRRMWVSASGKLWYESLQGARPALLVPSVRGGEGGHRRAPVLVISASTGTEAACSIGGKAAHPMRLNLLSHDGAIAPASPAGAQNARPLEAIMQTELWASPAQRSTYLAAETESQRDTWIACIASLAKHTARFDARMHKSLPRHSYTCVSVEI